MASGSSRGVTSATSSPSRSLVGRRATDGEGDRQRPRQFARQAHVAQHGPVVRLAHEPLEGTAQVAFGFDRKGTRPWPSPAAGIRPHPTTRDEDWRYTNLAALAATPFRLVAPSPDGDGVPAGTLEQLALVGAEWPRLVFLDGRYSPKLSTARPLPGGGRAASLAEALITDGELVERHLGRHAGWDGNVFAALSTAFVQDGAFVYLPAEARSETPIELLFLATMPGVVASPAP